MATQTDSQSFVSDQRRERVENLVYAFRHNTKAVVGLGLILGLTVLAILAPILVSQEAANQMNVQNRLQLRVFNIRSALTTLAETCCLGLYWASRLVSSSVCQALLFHQPSASHSVGLLDTLVVDLTT